MCPYDSDSAHRPRPRPPYLRLVTSILQYKFLTIFLTGDERNFLAEIDQADAKEGYGWDGPAFRELRCGDPRWQDLYQACSSERSWRKVSASCVNYSWMNEEHTFNGPSPAVLNIRKQPTQGRVTCQSAFCIGHSDYVSRFSPLAADL